MYTSAIYVSYIYDLGSRALCIRRNLCLLYLWEQSLGTMERNSHWAIQLLEERLAHSSPWKSEAENMADFGLCWRHMVPSTTGIYHWPTAMLCFWQSPSPPWFLQKKLWLSCFQNKIFMKNSFFSLVDGGTWKNNEKMFLLTGKSCETFKFFVVLPG